MQEANPSEIERRGWRQGSIFPLELVNRIVCGRLVPDIDPQRDILIVISQSCDLVNRAYKAEPRFEVLKATIVEAENGNFFYGKHPRKFQFRPGPNKSTPIYEVSIHDRYMLDRPILEDLGPSTESELNPETVDNLANWIAKRYKRSAFPSEFNDRCRTADKQIGRILRRGSKDISGIYLVLDPWEDISADDEYRLIITATYRPELDDDGDSLLELYNCFDELVDALNSCEGLVVAVQDVKSEKEFSLYDVRNARRWDYDYMTFSEKPGGDLAPDA